MALSNPKSVFGIHSVALRNNTTGEYSGILRVLGESSLAFSGEVIPLNGGSNKYPWVVEDGLITAEVNLSFREYPSFLFSTLAGATVTENAAEASGNVSAVANYKGTSAVDATTGIASVTAEAGSEADMKFGQYIIKAVSATTVDVFASTNVDFQRGTDATYEDDLLKITASPLTVPDTGGTVSIPNFGVEITGGSGSVAFTTDDTAEFDVRPINSGSRTIDVGSTSSTFPEFGLLAYSKPQSDGRQFEVELYRVKAVGLPLPMTENAFSEASITGQAFLDSALDKVFTIREVTP